MLQGENVNRPKRVLKSSWEEGAGNGRIKGKGLVKEHAGMIQAHGHQRGD